MQKKITKDDIEFKLFQDFWKFRQDCYEPKTDKEFETATKLAGELTKKYENTPLKDFSIGLAMLHLEDAELRYKNGR